MFVVTVIVSVVLAAMLTYSAVRKLSHRPDVVAFYASVGVPENRLNHLAFILLAGAAGLILGLLWATLGVVTASAVLLYFLLAIGAHIRANQLSSIPTPIIVAMFAAAALVLRIATL
jgi:hypothetical protein